jgi:hypothetical protein
MHIEAFAQTIGGFATSLGVLLALATLWHGLRQLKAGARLAAHDVYCNFVGVMMNYPEYFPPNYAKITHDPLVFARYKRFIAYLLTVCERMLLTEQETKYWVKTVEFYIQQNLEHLASEDFRTNHLPHYSLEMQRIIEVAIKRAQPASKAPEPHSAYTEQIAY